MQKISILGIDNMLGHLLLKNFQLCKDYQITGFKQKECLLLRSSLPENIDQTKPDVIINTLRITVQESKRSPEQALLVNTYIPKILEKYFFNTKIKIIQLSTDCVFSGEKGNYKEDDIPESKSVYGLSKFSGEIINKKDITIRTSYIGPCTKNKKEELFDWILNQTGLLHGYKNAYWNGVTTLELSHFIKRVIADDICGLYHLCSEKKISKYNLILIIKKMWSLNKIELEEKTIKKIDRSLIDSRKLYKVSNYDLMFKDLYEYMSLNKKLYEHYG